MDIPVKTLEPHLLGFWTRCIREASNWSQEALAASSNLDVRTIQRIEAGKVAPNLTTRRSLAKGLGYENPDVFDDPQLIKTVHELRDLIHKAQRDEIERQFPDHVPVSTTPVATGEDLVRIAECSEAYLFNSDDELAPEAKQVAATMFDYLRDLGDIISEVSCSDRLKFAQDLEQLLRELDGHGVKAYSAKRSTKMVGAFWKDKTPIPLAIGYLTVVPATKQVGQMMVPRRLS